MIMIKELGHMGESFFLYENDPSEIVMNLIIDDGVITRGNRNMIFSSKFKFVSVGCVLNAKFRLITELNYFGYR